MAGRSLGLDEIILDSPRRPRGMVALVIRTLTAEAMHEAQSLVLGASVYSAEPSRFAGITGNLDRQIQKPGSCW